ncbi:MAG: chemoreceptor glutamine deamidase CheD [Gammaproteobacteria bacterium]
MISCDTIKIQASPIQDPPPVLRGFEHVTRYWDPYTGQFAAKILPGEYYVTQHGELIVTVLGSCVSACIRCKATGFGGMNHFMLPENRNDHQDLHSGPGVNAAARYGNFAMEHMINDLLKLGVKRGNLEIKIVGGSRILKNMTDIGRRNIEFVREYIRTEQLRLAGEDVGDIYPRKVYYDPENGRVRVKKLRALRNDTIFEREARYGHELQVRPIAGDVELFSS